MDYVDVQISSTAPPRDVNDAVRGAGSFADRDPRDGSPRRRRDARLQDLGRRDARTMSSQLDAFEAIADRYGAQLRLTRLRPSGRGADTWDRLHPPQAQQRDAVPTGSSTRRNVLTGDSFFHLCALGDPLDGLNLCGAGPRRLPHRPVGDVYACPFVDPRGVPRRQRPRRRRVSPRSGGSPPCSPSCARRRARARARRCGSYDACRGGCMAAKFFTGLPLDGPDPECVLGHGDRRSRPPRQAEAGVPRPSLRSLAGRRLRRPVMRARWRTHADRLRRAGSRRSPSRSAGRAGACPRSVYGPLRRRLASGAARCAGQRGGVRRARVRPARRRHPRRRASSRTTVLGPGALDAGPHLADRGAGRPSRGRGRRRPGRRGPRRPRSGLSSFATRPVEDVVAANPKTFFQIYWIGTPRRDPRPDRAGAEPPGALGLIATLDWTFAHRPRLGGARRSPSSSTCRRCFASRRCADATRTWLLALDAPGRSPGLTVPNMAVPGAAGADVLRRLRPVDADPAADLG